jgi:adenylylsulfate kinase
MNLSSRLQRFSEPETLKMAKLGRELRNQGIDIIDLSLGEPDFDTPTHIKEAVKKAVDENYSHYTPVAGYPELRQAVCTKLKRDNNLDYKPENILVVHDELSLDFKTVKFSFGKSAAGNNGVADIISKLGNKNFSRIRIGIGPNPQGDERADYVLSKFKKEEIESLTNIFSDCDYVLNQWLNEPLDKIQSPSKDQNINSSVKLKKKMKYKLKKGLTLWLTGLSGSGKSTIANALTGKLSKNNQDFPLEMLDGDEIREHLNKDLGFERKDRITNIQRIAFLAGKISKHNVLVIVPVIAPYKEARELARTYSKNFLEVFIKASLEKVEERDVKGLYQKARAGEIKNFTGISDPYDVPENPDITLNTEETNINDSVEKLLNKLIELGYVENLSE